MLSSYSAAIVFFGLKVLGVESIRGLVAGRSRNELETLF
jgi:hypothetical protein